MSVPFDDAALRDPEIAASHGRAWMQALGDEAGPVMAAIAGALRDYPHCLVARDLDPEVGHALLAGLATALGELAVPADLPGYQVIRRLVPGHVGGIDNGRPLDELLHTDGSDEPTPNDITCLFCVRPDTRGAGESVILAEADAVAALCKVEGDLVDWLRRTPLPWRLSNDRAGRIKLEPALSVEGLRWMPYTVRQALGVGTDPALISRLNVVQASFEGARERHLRFPLQQGDLLILNNRRTLHARTSIPNPASSERVILRAKVARRTVIGSMSA